jgi:hypothetical protein
MSKSNKRKHSKGDKKPTLAERADKYDLYLKSVQDAEHEVYFLERAYKGFYSRPPQVLREDFCGTYAVCCEWVKSGSKRKAVGVDIDPEPLAWGSEHHLAKLKPAQQSRVQTLMTDVRQVTGPKADVVAAQNFSYWIFKTRAELLIYFKAAHANLKSRGVFVLDMMGGPEVLEEDEEDVTAFRGFDYVWHQATIDPITHECTLYIHFRFKDGSELHRAFSYEWRLWSIPEVRELLQEAGFKRSVVYWEDTDSKSGEGTGTYRKRKHAGMDPTWIAYIVGAK